MKRSEINTAIEEAIRLLDKYSFTLPRFAYFNPEEWRAHAKEIDTIRAVGLGWDVTDFGSNDFARIGAVLFTIRNGKPGHPEIGSPYAEKILVFRDGQRLPIHHHAVKTEDIINRAGGEMEMRFFHRRADGGVDTEREVAYMSDGIAYTAKAGEPLYITTGNSVRLDPFVNHTFGARKGGGPLICGEVSKINDDLTDNYFAEPTARFAEIEEDDPARFVLCNEYERLVPRE